VSCKSTPPATTPPSKSKAWAFHYNEGDDLLDYLVDPTVFQVRNGMVKIPNGPGLGIEINEEYVRAKAEEGHNWKNPIWRHKDGAMAEW
jgi:galactonate dehydratase